MCTMQLKTKKKKTNTKKKPLFTWTWEKKNLKKCTNGGKQKTKIIALTEKKKNKTKLHNSMNNKSPHSREKNNEKHLHEPEKKKINLKERWIVHINSAKIKKNTSTKKKNKK